jgi:dipeptidyl aminopeptidase/acylaminoacyl peptidase
MRFENFVIFFADSFFTERYFTTNSKESTALDDDLASKAQELQGRNFFLIQGTGDEVVHEQHAFSLVKSLVEKEVIFRQQVGREVDRWSEE